LFGQQLVWPLPRQQLIKNSIFISPIIHFDFIVEWMALGGRAAVGFWSDWSELVGMGGRGVANCASHNSKVFTFLHIDFDGTFTLAFALCISTLAI